ncbi:MAG TPA: hypothetical protein VLK53_15100 [Gaiellaceae bacterium]|nr:hypothetical protein [Gaiellaceae bacterium]
MRRLVVILAAVGLLVAGCGSSSSKGTTTTVPTGPPLTKADYQAKLKQIATEISQEIGKTSSSGNEIPKEDVDKLVKAFHEFAARLAAVNPPAAVKAIHADLVKTMNDLGDGFPAIAKQLNSSGNDRSAAVSALLGAKAIQELIKVGNDFKAKGYKLDLNP